MCLTNVLDASITQCVCTIPIWDEQSNAEIYNDILIYRCFNCTNVIPLEHYYCNPESTKYIGTTVRSFKAKKIKDMRLYSCGHCNRYLFNKKSLPYTIGFLKGTGVAVMLGTFWGIYTTLL